MRAPCEGGGMPRKLVAVDWEVAADEKFAKMFISDQLRKRPVGSKFLRSKLRLQGVRSDVVESSVGAALSYERELELAHRALDRRPQQEDPMKALRFLLGRGFRDSIARRAAAQRYWGDADSNA